MSEKWDELHGDKSYGAGTIEKAISGHTGGFYKGKLTAPPELEVDGIPGEVLQETAAPVAIPERPEKAAKTPPQDNAPAAEPFHLTELGNAERLAARHRGRVYAVRGIGELRGYDPKRGIYTTENGLLLRYAKDVVRRSTPRRKTSPATLNRT